MISRFTPSSSPLDPHSSSLDHDSSPLDQLEGLIHVISRPGTSTYIPDEACWIVTKTKEVVLDMGTFRMLRIGVGVPGLNYMDRVLEKRIHVLVNDMFFWVGKGELVNLLSEFRGELFLGKPIDMFKYLDHAKKKVNVYKDVLMKIVEIGQVCICVWYGFMYISSLCIITSFFSSTILCTISSRYTNSTSLYYYISLF